MIMPATSSAGMVLTEDFFFQISNGGTAHILTGQHVQSSDGMDQGREYVLPHSLMGKIRGDSGVYWQLAKRHLKFCP